MMKKTRGTFLLFLAALVWGMAFVAQSSAADRIGAFTFNAARSFLAAVFLLIVIGVRNFISIPSEKSEKKEIPGSSLIGGILCGILLFLAVNLQQFGITAYPENTAASGRAGFLTATYVVMVALFVWITGKKLRPAVLIATAGCVVGVYLLCLSDGFSGFYLGDALVLAGAAGFAGYILIIDYFSKLDSLKISCIQFFVCGTLSLIAMFILEKPNAHMLLAAWLPILYTGILSSGVGYTLQIIGQKYTEPAVASIVMSLESVFAALAGWVILNEHLSGNELIGCGLVFISVILVQIPDFIKPETEKQEDYSGKQRDIPTNK
ncbi:DMT family transporter [Papillibacter cinnamivorans]|uniref:Permease of the drug/metabolite transporter (DMT) superfamily n=1 Tax=Papillibacter cinnamivorans DSM 12816 TaxID=1122930 RepID=A0A1W2BV08_9FIRM|nr:Permease of the drug/metabolite transporter (DMT) superfamily [Papillibacter cinnamivorans DSM 12816]